MGYICGLLPQDNTVVNIYNASASDDKKIKMGDFIVSVNGMTGASASMSGVLKQSQNLQVRIQRPMKFAVTCAKQGDTVGLDLKFGPSGNTLPIEGIKDGAVKSRAPEILPGDRIVGVNGVTGTSSTLMKAMQDNDPLELELVRVRKPK